MKEGLFFFTAGQSWRRDRKMVFFFTGRYCVPSRTAGKLCMQSLGAKEKSSCRRWWWYSQEYYYCFLEATFYGAEQQHNRFASQDIRHSSFCSCPKHKWYCRRTYNWNRKDAPHLFYRTALQFVWIPGKLAHHPNPGRIPYFTLGWIWRRCIYCGHADLYFNVTRPFVHLRWLHQMKNSALCP